MGTLSKIYHDQYQHELKYFGIEYDSPRQIRLPYFPKEYNILHFRFLDSEVFHLRNIQILSSFSDFILKNIHYKGNILHYSSNGLVRKIME